MSHTFKQVVVNIRIYTLFVLLRTFGGIVYDFAQKYGNRIEVKDLRKFERLQIKACRLKLDINFLKNCESFQVFPKFVCYVKLPNTNHTEKYAIRKKLLKSALLKREKEYQKIEYWSLMVFLMMFISLDL